MTSKKDTPSLSRRQLLGRLGLAAGAAYVAPVMLHMSPAHASGASAASGASSPSPASGPSAPSSPSGPSRPSRPGSRSDWRGNSGMTGTAGDGNEMPLWMRQLLGLR